METLGGLHIRLENDKRSKYPYSPCFVLCGGHFEFFKRVRSASARSGTEITEIARSLLGALRK